ncbi:macro domain-containing protein [Streptomyces sp. FXJ1.172]|uniref:macro domain-containing protein n=1 Tax=Streptomyces sp. FXJ1.172 TaxID=710705 RepID=UPI000A85E5C8|nr:macro domain-containing protein [Streptomyces sp. FXJ1.172]WEO92992.1 macro domain-containing protein [Streptomyces sp. FXJ1.172]
MTESSVLSALRVVLTDVNERVVEAWRAAFADTPGIEIRKGSILDEDVDAWVTPTNSQGRMDGGVDAVIKRCLGSGIQVRVQRAIRDRFAGPMPVGSAVCVPSGATVPLYLISTPTTVRSSQNVSATLNVALECAAAFQAVHRQNRKKPGSIRSVALVGMGAQTGQVPAQVCANLMWTGYTLFHDHWFEDDDELRSTIISQLHGIENAPVDQRVRIVRPAATPVVPALAPETAAPAPSSPSAATSEIASAMTPAAEAGH